MAADHTPAGVAASAAVLSEAAALFRSTGQKEERVLVLEAWRDALAAGGASEDELDKVEAMMPKRLKKRRQVYGEDGEAAGCAPSQHPIAPHTPRAAPGALATVHSPTSTIVTTHHTASSLHSRPGRNPCLARTALALFPEGEPEGEPTCALSAATDSPARRASAFPPGNPHPTPPFSAHDGASPLPMPGLLPCHLPAIPALRSFWQLGGVLRLHLPRGGGQGAIAQDTRNGAAVEEEEASGRRRWSRPIAPTRARSLDAGLGLNGTESGARRSRKVPRCAPDAQVPNLDNSLECWGTR